MRQGRVEARKVHLERVGRLVSPALWWGRRSPSGDRGRSCRLFTVRQRGVKIGKVHLKRVRRCVTLLLGSPGLGCLLPGLLPRNLNRLPGCRNRLPGFLPGCLNRLPGHLGQLPWHLGKLPGRLNRLPPSLRWCGGHWLLRLPDCRLGEPRLVPGPGSGDALEVDHLCCRSWSLLLLRLLLRREEGRLLCRSTGTDPGALVPPGEAGGEVSEGLREGCVQRELALLLGLLPRLLLLPWWLLTCWLLTCWLMPCWLLVLPRLLLLQFDSSRSHEPGLTTRARLPLSAAVSPQAVGEREPLMEAMLDLFADLLLTLLLRPRLSVGLEELRL